MTFYQQHAANGVNSFLAQNNGWVSRPAPGSYNPYGGSSCPAVIEVYVGDRLVRLVQSVQSAVTVFQPGYRVIDAAPSVPIPVPVPVYPVPVYPVPVNRVPQISGWNGTGATAGTTVISLSGGNPSGNIPWI